MVLSKSEPEIDLKELINSRLTEWDIYHMYVPEIKLNTVMKSPFRQDRHPSFSLGASSSGRLIWKDYSMDEMGGWTDLVGKMYNLNYRQVLQKVARDFFLLDGKDSHQKIVSAYKQPIIEPRRSLIQVCTRRMAAGDLKWWEQFQITAEDLKKEDVYAVDSYYINRQRQILKYQEKCYAYYYGDNGFKIYHPERTKDEGRWKSSIPCSLIEGIDKLNGQPKVLITKAKKDRLSIQHIVGIPVLNTQNEGQSCFTEEVLKKLQGKTVYINYDSDQAGKANSKKITGMYGYKHINVPDNLWPIKDFADMVKEYGIDEVKQYMNIKGVI